MKVRDSGMPDEEMWSDFFDPAKILAIFGLDCGVQDMVEFGCGYGNFTLSAAKNCFGNRSCAGHRAGDGEHCRTKMP